MPPLVIPPLIKWTLVALGGAAMVHWTVKEVRRVNEELDRAKARARIKEYPPLRTLRRDPLLGLAKDIDHAAGADVAALRDALRQTLHNAITRNRGRAFGVCRTCHHFRAHVRPSTRTPHHCALLDEPLSEGDSLAICAEQEPAVA